MAKKRQRRSTILLSKKEEAEKISEATKQRSIVRPPSWKEGDFKKPIAINSKYPPPESHPIFVARWNDHINDLASRENFSEGHLSTFRVFCRMYVELDYLEEFIRLNGFSFESYGRYGYQSRPFPEIVQINKTRSEIRNFSKFLGLMLVKELGPGNDEPDEWT